MTFLRVNLGCPDFCGQEWTCVDLNPRDSRVFQEDAINYMGRLLTSGFVVDEYRAFNVLEHLPDPGRFLRLTYSTLKRGGVLTLKTDNAAWLPFYLPFWIQGSGIGAHSQKAYAATMNQSKHLCIFSKMHLENLLAYAGFSRYSVSYDLATLGARLIVKAIR